MDAPVGIIGAGPGGLVLAHLLRQHGVESIVLESRSREYVERRVRAGVLEQGTVDLLRSIGVAGRLEREGLVHTGLRFRFDGEEHRIALSDLTGGRAITVYGQQEVVKDLIAAHIAAGGQILFEAEALGIEGIASTAPTIRYRQGGRDGTLRCAFVAGCDGTHGVARDAMPSERLTVYEHEYPLAWLGILAAAPPSTEELIYAQHERGFALHSMRTPEISRLYLQVAPDERLDDWSDDRVWSELRRRLALPGWSLADGPILERGITQMRSLVVEPMQHGRLFLVGDAAHVVPATGAKGLNLAVNDASILSAALVRFFVSGDTGGLEGYSAACLRRVWRAQHFSWWMTSMLHRFESDSAFERQLRLSQLRYVCSSPAAATSLAENYVGLARV